MSKSIAITIATILCVQIAYCAEYNPTNFEIIIDQKDLVKTRNLLLNLYLSGRHILGEDLEYAARVYMRYPPLYMIIGNKRQYLKSIKFELYKEKRSDDYAITYDINILRDSFFAEATLKLESYNVPMKKKVSEILNNTPYLRKDDLGRFGAHGSYFPDLSMMTVPMNLKMLKNCVELLNMVLPDDRKIMFDKDDLDVKYPSWFSAITWRRKILGL